MARDSTSTVAHQIPAERRSQEVAETGRERKIALVDRMHLPREKLAGNCRRHDDGVGEGERDLGQHGEFGAMEDLRPGRHDEMRQMQPEIEHRNGGAIPTI